MHMAVQISSVFIGRFETFFLKNVPVSGEMGSGRNLLHGLPVWLSSGEFKG